MGLKIWRSLHSSQRPTPEWNRLPMISLLVQNGTDVNAVSKAGDMSFHQAMRLGHGKCSSSRQGWLRCSRKGMDGNPSGLGTRCSFYADYNQLVSYIQWAMTGSVTRLVISKSSRASLQPHPLFTDFVKMSASKSNKINRLKETVAYRKKMIDSQCVRLA